MIGKEFVKLYISIEPYLFSFKIFYLGQGIAQLVCCLSFMLASWVRIPVGLDSGEQKRLSSDKSRTATVNLTDWHIMILKNIVFAYKYTDDCNIYTGCGRLPETCGIFSQL